MTKKGCPAADGSRLGPAAAGFSGDMACPICSDTSVGIVAIFWCGILQIRNTSLLFMGMAVHAKYNNCCVQLFFIGIIIVTSHGIGCVVLHIR